MTLKLNNTLDLDFYHEATHNRTGEFVFTEFGLILGNGEAYFGRVRMPKIHLSDLDVCAALRRIPDEDIYCKMSELPPLSIAPREPRSEVYIKRPSLLQYQELKNIDRLDTVYGHSLDEAKNAERISKLPPHPGILRYHGCMTNRGYLTGIVYDKHVSDLGNYIVTGEKPRIHKKSFMNKLVSAVAHLHFAGIAHNDISPGNVLVDTAGQPILADFDSCYPFGEVLEYRRGTPGWIEDNDPTKHTRSDPQHDLYALKKLRMWLDEVL